MKIETHNQIFVVFMTTCAAEGKIRKCHVVHFMSKIFCGYRSEGDFRFWIYSNNIARKNQKF